MNQKKNLIGARFGILGDSYSTFKDHIPEGNRCYYPNPERVDDVLAVEQTWWHILMTKNNLQLLRNESYSGATVCTHTREGQPPESSFTVRAHYLKNFVDENGAGPELIILFGCTNDSWFDRTIGVDQYENWTDEDLQQTLPAYSYTVHTLKTYNPDAAIVAIINTGLGTYCSENFANFVTGAKDIDDDAAYEQFIKDFENYNLSRITEIRQACYDRYLAR